MELSNFIKYCLGYVKLTQQRTFISAQKDSLDLSNEYFNLSGLLNGETDGELGELIDLSIFYSLDPNDVDEKREKQYNKEKELANKIETIYNKQRNNPFTKQVVCSFGFFEIEIPLDIEEDVLEPDQDPELETKKKTKIDRFPLFSIPVQIEKTDGKYLVYFIDPEIQVNLGIMEPILGEDLYYQLIEEVSAFELDGQLSLPINDKEVFITIWHKIKEKLKLKEAKFDEKSFKLEELKLSLSPKANYFLAEDLQKLGKLNEEELQNTCLLSWVSNEDLTIDSGVPSETELYFPFLYDKYQLRTLSVINNKTAIIQGPPGTGKSETISNILCHLAATGKRVLFVSQKAQALKVVKDKLKKLDVQYLFGYLPNPASAQLGEQDEIDGIAPQLTALESYIGKLGYKYNSRKKYMEYDNNTSDNKIDLGSVVEVKNKLQNSYQNTINAEREIFVIVEKLKVLKTFEVPIDNIEIFRNEFSSQNSNQLREFESLIEETEASIRSYQRNAQKREYDKVLANVDLENHQYSKLVAEIRADVSKTGYDRHFGLFRKLNNTFRSARLSKVRTQLPRELIDLIDNFLSSDISRSAAANLLDSLEKYLCYFENQKALKNYNTNHEELLKTCGLANEQFQDIYKLKIETGLELDAIKEKIIEVLDLTKQLNALIEKSVDLSEITKKYRKTNLTQREMIAQYIQNIVNNKVLDQWKKGITIKQIIKKLAKAFGKSKKAYKTFDNLRKDPDNFNAILDLIPIWIMELDDASRIIPLEAGIFDYVILDEASQCNVAYTLPVMFRAKHTLFVGDSEQMRDNTILFKSNKAFDELARRFRIPEEMQIKASGTAVQSVLDVAGLRGFMSMPLHYHYRSPHELIGFSNNYFYKPKGKELIALNSSYLTYRDTDRVMLTHYVEPRPDQEISDRVNIAEINKILELFKDLRSDSRYADKSIGILTFFNDQATKIREIFEENGYKEERDNFKVSIIEGIQGDEKDIIIYSFVIRSPEQKNKYLALTGEKGDIRSDINQGRVNVAFSRARLQVHCITSLKNMPEGIWLKKYLEYVDENGKVDFYETDLQPFDSYFEDEFYHFTRKKLGKDYNIQNQVKSCGFKIDFVITNSSNGRRLAVECDGPCHFEDEIDQEYGIYVESDEERQRVLEAAGWTFYRIKYSDWINENFDRSSVSREIEKQLV